MPRPLPSGTVGLAYAGVQFAATGGTPPYAFSVATGSNLPPGLQLTAGDLTGTPTTEGNFSFGISVTDSESPAAVITNTFTLVVNPVQDLTLLTGSFAFNFSGNNASGESLRADLAPPHGRQSWRRARRVTFAYVAGHWSSAASVSCSVYNLRAFAGSLTQEGAVLSGQSHFTKGAPWSA